MNTGKPVTDEEFRAIMRAATRRDGAGPYPSYFTGGFEHYVVDEGETMRDAMLDHLSPTMVFVATVGTEFEQSTCFDAPLTPQACYANARLIAKEKRKDGWRYVEGWAKHNHPLMKDTLVRHAWVVDENGWAVEVTWDDVSDFYLGVVFDKIPPKREENVAITDSWALKQLAKIAVVK